MDDDQKQMALRLNRIRSLQGWLERQPLHRQPVSLNQYLDAAYNVSPDTEADEIVTALLWHVRTCRQLLGDDTGRITPKPEVMPKRRLSSRKATRTKPAQLNLWKD